MEMNKLSKEGLQTSLGTWNRWEQNDTLEELDPGPYPGRFFDHHRKEI